MFIYSYSVVYPLFGELVFRMCDSHVCVVQRRCNFDVQFVRFRARAYEFLSEVMECCMTRMCGAFDLLYLTLNACVNVKMETVIVGYFITVYGRSSFTNDIFVSFHVM